MLRRLWKSQLIKCLGGCGKDTPKNVKEAAESLPKNALEPAQITPQKCLGACRNHSPKMLRSLWKSLPKNASEAVKNTILQEIMRKIIVLMIIIIIT